MTDREYLDEAREWLEHIKNLTGWTAADSEKLLRRMKTLEWLIEQAEKAEKYREVLEFYANGNHYSCKLYDDKIILLDDGEKARQALEG